MPNQKFAERDPQGDGVGSSVAGDGELRVLLFAVETDMQDNAGLRVGRHRRLWKFLHCHPVGDLRPDEANPADRVVLCVVEVESNLVHSVPVH